MARKGCRHRSDGERGAILIVVLVLSVTFAALSMALLATAEMSLRVQSNGRDIEHAERAAQSGIEWAAAAVKANGLVDGARSTTLTPGVIVAAQVRSATAPQLVGGGSAYGVEARYAADAAIAAGPFPHAFLAFGGQVVTNDTVTIRGQAYSGEVPTPLTFNASRPLQMNGNLELVATTAPNHVSHVNGATSLGVAKIAEPVWNTTRFAVPVGWTVPVLSRGGSQTISNTTINGILVVSLIGSQTLTLDQVTVNGTIVVPSLYPPLLDLLGTPTIQLGENVVVNGGTAETGNLAILAPAAKLVGAKRKSNTVRGVVYVGSIEDLGDLTFQGQVMVRKGISSNTNGTVVIDRSASFVPTVPYGISWTGASTVRITWRGKQ